MILYLIDWLDGYFDLDSIKRLFGYITFRAGVAIMLSLVISMLFGGRIIRLLRSMQVGEEVRDLGLEGQKAKQGTPTMGGIIIVMAILIPCWLVADLNNLYIALMLVATSWMTVIGFIDDYIKVFRKNKKGLHGRFKVMGQIGLGIFIAISMMRSEQIVVRMDVDKAAAIGLTADQMVGDTIFTVDQGKITAVKGDYKTLLTNVPFFKGNQLDYTKLVPLAPHLVWIIFIPLVVFIVTAVSNAANLTDGIDGLATGVSGIIGITLAIFAYVSSNAIAANYLNILHLPGSGELVIYGACFLGACMGFLWYNTYPASVFMGDTGSLMLGGAIASMALLLRKELLIPLLCGIFLAENLSVVIQVAYFKYTKRKYGEGRRVLLMSPLHHHYQKKGIHEAKIVSRFLIVGALLAVATILTLKIR